MSDDQTVEIAPCPVCGNECLIAHPQYGQTQITCLTCDYRSKRLDDVNPSRVIAAHNALCAAVKRGRGAAKIEQTARRLLDLRHENEALLDMIDKAEAERDALRAEVDRLKTAIADLRYAFDDPVVVERIAAWSHKSWAGWYRWMAMKWHEVHQNTGESFRDRWKRQSETPYVKLSDSEQNSDRAEAKEVLNVLYEILPWPRFESKKGEDCEGHSIARADTGYGESSDSSGTKQ